MIECVSLIISVASIVVATIIGCGQIYLAKKMKDFEQRQDKRDEMRRNDAMYAKTTEFIQRYNGNGHKSEILLLPLCVAVYKYNPTYPYQRGIYKDFCSLTEDMQNMILERCGLTIRSGKMDDYYDRLLNAYRQVQKTYCPDDRDIFNDNGKYLERALLHRGEEPVPDLICATDDTQRQINESPMGKAFGTGDDETMAFREHISNEIYYRHDNAPIKRLFIEHTNQGSASDGDEIVISYLCCIVAKYVSVYSHNEPGPEYWDTGCVEDYHGQLFMEDLFLDALHTMEIYNS